ncbi:UNVERIFIED_CONTAM: hypothetical protein RMT77_010372 [Armadillidium vulgare]
MTSIHINLRVLSIIVCLSICDLEDLCDVSNDCEGKEVGTLIQDPLNCHRFYQCVLNSEGEVRVSDSSILCHYEGRFNEETQQCEDDVSTCVDKCSNLMCPKTCEGLPDGTRIAVPYDCFLFQICNHEVDLPIYGTCLLSNPYFNGTDCCFDAFSCCNICMPYCQFANTQVEDPANCNRYYLCEKDDYIPGSSEHFDCPEDTHFDRTLGECVEGYECDTVCVHGIDKRK